MISIVKLQPTLISVSYGNPTKSDRICAFDLDGTLVMTTTKDRRFPANADDWKWITPTVPERLRKLHDAHWQLVIITNQAGISTRKQSEKEVLERISNVLTELNLPIQVYVATAKDYWRKPNSSIVEHYILVDNPIPPDFIYVGDAAGRQHDFADTDRKFAYNVYLLMKYLYPELPKSKHPGFKTEKEFFMHEPAQKLHWRGFDSSEYIKKNSEKTVIPELKKPFLVVMIGPPGSGKSTIAQEISKATGAIVLSQDKSTKAACIKATKNAIAETKCIVVDNTNSSNAERKTYTDLVNQDYTIKYVEMLTGIELAKHMNYVRERSTGFNMWEQKLPVSSHHIPDVVYAKFAKSFETPPSADTIKISFTPKFSSKRNIMYFLQRDE